MEKFKIECETTKVFPLNALLYMVILGADAHKKNTDIADKSSFKKTVKHRLQAVTHLI